MSISFEFSSNNRPLVCFSEQTYPAVISWEGRLKIIIDSKVFFEEPEFPILELVRTIEKWEGIDNFCYNCIETDANPLISFTKTTIGWKIYSPWQKFVCDKPFTIYELLEAKESLIVAVQSHF